jgi:type IX secretion system PorP/SprF family membrane protein
MKHNYRYLKKLYLPAIFLLIASYVQAQKTDWDDSIQMKEQMKEQKRLQRKEVRQIKSGQRRNDTTKYYQPHLSIGMFNHFHENPGFCGYEQLYTFSGGFQNDIPFYKVDNDLYHPYSWFGSFDCSMGPKKKHGLGLNIKQAKAGAVGLSAIDLVYSFKLHFGKYNNLRLGISVEAFSIGMDWDRMTYPDMISRHNGFVFNTTEIRPGHLDQRSLNFNAGITYSRKRFYAGFSVLNITKPDQGFVSLARMPRLYLLSSGYTFVLSRKLELSPSAQLRFIEKEFTANIHLTGVFWKHFIAGVSLNELTTASVDLGCTFWRMLTFYTSCGMSMNSELYHHFGPLDYVSANLRFQFGAYQKN